MQIKIGTWHETASREFSHCPSYYAADHETLRVKTGDYSLYVTFQGGYLTPMPYWLLSTIDTDRIDGALYSGCGGLNFASTPLPRESVRYTIQMYSYQLRELVENGRVTLDQKFNWLLDDLPWKNADAPKDWDAVRALEN